MALAAYFNQLPNTSTSETAVVPTSYPSYHSLEASMTPQMWAYLQSATNPAQGTGEATSAANSEMSYIMNLLGLNNIGNNTLGTVLGTAGVPASMPGGLAGQVTNIGQEIGQAGLTGAAQALAAQGNSLEQLAGAQMGGVAAVGSNPTGSPQNNVMGGSAAASMYPVEMNLYNSGYLQGTNAGLGSVQNVLNTRNSLYAAVPSLLSGLLGQYMNAYVTNPTAALQNAMATLETPQKTQQLYSSDYSANNSQTNYPSAGGGGGSTQGNSPGTNNGTNNGTGTDPNAAAAAALALSLSNIAGSTANLNTAYPSSYDYRNGGTQPGWSSSSGTGVAPTTAPTETY